MEPPRPASLRIGDWCVDPAARQISRNGQTARLEERAMRLLLCLADHAGKVVSIDDLLNHVWSEVTVTPDSVYQAVASLRRVLGDDPRQPTYIATVPRLGYRMLATVGPLTDQTTPQTGENPESPRVPCLPRPSENPESPRIPRILATTDTPTRAPRLRPGLRWLALAVVLIGAVLAVFLVVGNGVNKGHAASVASASPKSIAVLPFLDLTEGMKQEEFADGMTEELIDKLSKIQGLRVPPPTSSFYFKGKKVPVADIAAKLNVAYVLDGSVRKSGGRLRVAARLIRADTGYVIWSESYDRPWSDVLMVQDDIAAEVTKSLRVSIESNR